MDGTPIFSLTMGAAATQAAGSCTAAESQQLSMERLPPAAPFKEPSEPPAGTQSR